MKISKQILGRCSKDLLDFLEREKIEGVVDLEMQVGKQYSVEGRNFVSIRKRSAGFLAGGGPYTEAYVVEYCVPVVGNIISLNMYYDLSSMFMIIRCILDIKGYKRALLVGGGMVDRDRNIVQEKYIKESTDFSLLKKELKELSELT